MSTSTACNTRNQAAGYHGHIRRGPHIILFLLPNILFHNSKSSHPLFFAHVPMVLTLFLLKSSFSFNWKRVGVDPPLSAKVWDRWRTKAGKQRQSRRFRLARIKPDVRLVVSLILISPELAGVVAILTIRVLGVVMYTAEITSSYEAFHVSCTVVFPIIPK